jgi:hypothetical protein
MFKLGEVDETCSCRGSIFLKDFGPPDVPVLFECSFEVFFGSDVSHVLDDQCQRSAFRHQRFLLRDRAL